VFWGRRLVRRSFVGDQEGRSKIKGKVGGRDETVVEGLESPGVWWGVEREGGEMSKWK